jgi:hypothetical protein
LAKTTTNAEIYKEIILIKEMLARREHLDSLILKHEEKITGNGKPGLAERMALSEEREAKRDRREWFIGTILFTEVIGIAIMFLTFLKG